MCFDVDAQPPESPYFSGAAANMNDLVLTSADGTRVAAYAARAGAPAGSGIIILPDVRGLFQFYKDLAVRFAEAGSDAIAIDYFGRTAGLGPRDDQFDFMPHVMQTQAANIAADVASAVAYLRSPQGGAPRAIFTVGFCFGGANSWMQAANGHGLAGVIGFYGRPAGPSRDGSPTPIERAGEFRCPVLGLFGGADEGIPQSTVAEFDAALARAQVPHELHTYPGAPHSFFDRKYEEFASESQDAWRRMLAFMSARTPTA